MSKIKNEFKINKTQIIVFGVFVILIVAMGCYSLDNTTSNTNNINYANYANYKNYKNYTSSIKNINSTKHDISEEELQEYTWTPELAKRMSRHIPESRKYIRIKVQNTKTQEQMEIICLLSEWKNICMNRLKLVENESLYDEYMHKNAGKIFDVDDAFYSELSKFDYDKSPLKNYKKDKVQQR